jgi:hypothetical protein
VNAEQKKAEIPQVKKHRPVRKRLGLDGYARIYCRLKRGASEEDLRLEGYITSKHGVKTIIASLYKLGRIRVKEWRMAYKRPLQAVYCLSDSEPDATPPETRANGRPVQNPHIPQISLVPSELLAFNSLLEAIEDRQATVRQIQDRTGISHQTIRKALKKLCPACAHTCAWPQSTGNMLAAAYTLRSGMNVPKPVRTRADHCRDYRRRKAIKRQMALATATPFTQMAAMLAANDERRAA